MALLSYDMIRKIRSVADEYAKLERSRQAELVESRRAEKSGSARGGGAGRHDAAQPSG